MFRNIAPAGLALYGLALLVGAACTTGENPQYATAADRTYTTPPWISADGVIWTPPYSAGGSGVEVSGSGERSFYDGGIDGPLPLNAVYECAREDDDECPVAGTSLHCPGGDEDTCAVCPTPCYEYHTNEAVAHATTGRMSYQDQCYRDYGDGISAEDLGSVWSGEIEVARGYFTAIHDDAIEHDGCKSIYVRDTFLDGVNMGFAMRPRSGDGVDCEDSTIRLEDVLVRLHRFTYSYKNRPGTGGVFKLADGNLPWFQITGSTFLIGGPNALPGDGQSFLPPPGRIAQASHCEGNTLLFAGTEAQRAAWLADDDGSDGLTNAQRLSALSYCYTFVAKPDSQTYADFIWQYWLPLSSEWNVNHQSAGGC
jgi:hypothetical protein